LRGTQRAEQVFAVLIAAKLSQTWKLTNCSIS
jgi:hypothetical protein